MQAAEAKAFDGLNRDATIAGVTGGYDLRGNLTFDGDRTFVYDVENRLISASGTTIPGATFEYDPEGRLSKITSGATVTTFLYDGVNLIGEYDSSGNLKRRYIHGDGTDNPLVWLEETPSGEERRFFQKNYQGSIIGYSDDQGNLTEMYRYGAYGEPMGETGTNELWTGSRFRYTGQTVLTEARLYYYKARVYDPKFGRFLQTDPIGTKDDLDLYAYVKGDPINAADPTGTEFTFKRLGDYVTGIAQGGAKAVTNSLADMAIMGNPFGADKINADRDRLNSAIDSLGNNSTVNARGQQRGYSGVMIGALLAGGKGAQAKVGPTIVAGDLTAVEMAQIQSVVSQAGRPLEVVGSAARGTRRNIGTDLPFGKGAGTRSDIDYLVPPSSMQHYEGLQAQLPGIDPKTGIVPGTANPNIGPSVRFEPKP